MKRRKIRHELDEFRDATIAKAESGQCECSCATHQGQIRAVRVFGKDGEDWGYFSYCETARDEDTENRGMSLEYA